MEKRYKKVSYLYGKAEFFLYAPMDIEVISERKDVNNKTDRLTYKEDGEEHNFDTSHPYEIVRDFTPNDKNMLVSDYKGKIIVAYTDHLTYSPNIKHEKVKVLVEKRGSYTMLECLHCGAKSPIALNSMYLNGNEELEVCKNDFGK